jgi:short-subunit dehydrogenase
VRNTVAPHVYLVGRNEIEASRIQVELKALNAEAQVSFIQGDLTLLKNVDRVCTDIKAKEHSLNLLFMSTGFLSLAGRTGEDFQ